MLMINARWTLLLICLIAFMSSSITIATQPYREESQEDNIKSFASPSLPHVSLTQENEPLTQEEQSPSFLNLKKCGIDRSNVLDVSMYLRDCDCKLYEIDFSENAIDVAGAWTLSKTFAYYPNLTALNFSKNNINDEGIHYLATLTRLVRLDLSENKIGNKGASSLTSLTQLEDLNLASNVIGLEGFKDLAFHFGDRLHKKRSIDLRKNPLILDKPYEHYGFPPMRDISNIELGPEVFTSPLAFPSIPYALTLKGQELSVAAILKLKSLLENNRTLTRLIVSHTSLKDQEILTLTSCLASTKVPLVDLDISYNQITDKGGSYLLKALSQQTTLKHINVVGNPLSPSMFQALESAIDERQSKPTSPIRIHEKGLLEKGKSQESSNTAMLSTEGPNVEIIH